MSVAAKAETNILPWLTLREALERVGFEVLRPYLHTGHIPARHRGLYTSPSGEVRSGPGDIPLTLWANAYKDPDGRVFFVTEWVEDGRVIQEKRFAYTLDIDLDRAAFERFFPATPAVEPKSAQPADTAAALQEPERKAAEAAPAVEPEPVSPSLPDPPPPKPELAKAEPTRWQRDRTIEAIKSFYPPDGIRPKGVSIAALTKRINKLPEFKVSEVGKVSEDTVGRALEAIKVDLKK